MARREAWSAGALALLALWALVEAARLDVGSPTRPGPGFFPLVLAAALLVVALVLVVNAFRVSPGAPPPSSAREGTDRWKLLATLGAFALYVVAFEPLGFLLATVAWLAFLLGALARYRWPVAVGAAVVITAVAYLVFDTWLGVRLPPGLLGRW